jgi:hypothetical protein
MPASQAVPVRWRSEWLIRKLRVYLNGFGKHGIWPKTAKDSQKVAGEKYAACAFTMPSLTTITPYAR